MPHIRREPRHLSRSLAYLRDLARRAGIDYFRIMAITGQKMMAVFKRYNRIDQRDLQGAIRQLDA